MCVCVGGGGGESRGGGLICLHSLQKAQLDVSSSEHPPHPTQHTPSFLVSFFLTGIGKGWRLPEWRL